MRSTFVAFDRIVPKIADIIRRSLQDFGTVPPPEVWVIRDFTGRCRLLAPDDAMVDGEHAFLRHLAEAFHLELGSHSYEPDEALLPIQRDELDAFRSEARSILIEPVRLQLVERLLTGGDWAAVPDIQRAGGPVRFALFSLKGGMGRSTTAAVISHHLARAGHRVLLVDLDLESPGLSSALLNNDDSPEFGIVDWFVEDLVGQGCEVLPHMTARARWGQDLPGDIVVAPAHGRNPGEYLSKLGRVFIEGPLAEGAGPETWRSRLKRLLTALEEQERPEVVLIDSRSGLHDIAAAVIAHLQAHTLLFCTDSHANWLGYRLLFEHWNAYNITGRIRDRLSVVAALVPPDRSKDYLAGLRERAWDLFRENLYDEVPAEEPGAETFSFDLMDEDAPHTPLPVYWNPGLASLSSLRELDESAILPAYQYFLPRFEQLWSSLREE